jgi:hypothetical protein
MKRVLNLLIISHSVLRRVMFQTKVENIKTHFIFNSFFPKIVHFIRYMEKYCREGQAADESIAPLKHIAFWVRKATDTHLLVLHCNIGCTNTPQYYVIRTFTLPVLF